jgi:predicted HicB family RNase H-like nuclease
MKKELSDKIINAYPDMFTEDSRGPGKSTMFRNYIECGDGWFDILWRLCDDIHAMRPKVQQIKEKFGGLRFYASFNGDYTDQGWERIKKAEEEASETCEQCGQPGELRNAEGWWETSCEKCHKENLERLAAQK